MVNVYASSKCKEQPFLIAVKCIKVDWLYMNLGVCGTYVMIYASAHK